MERETILCCEGFESLDRNGMMTVEGGSLQKISEVVRTVARMVKIIAGLSGCVDDFLEGYYAGLAEATR